MKGIVVALCLLGAGGCATSERKIAARQDLTPHIIKQASDLLAADPELSRYSIEIDGFKGDMRLRGKVATLPQKARAGRMVWAVRGVKSVENDLEIVPGGK